MRSDETSVLREDSVGLSVSEPALSPRVLAGPFRVRLDYRMSEVMRHAVGDAYVRKSGCLVLAIALWFLLISVQGIGGSDSRIAVLCSAVMLAFAIAGVFLIVAPPQTVHEPSDFRFFGMRGVSSGIADHSVCALVDVSVTEFGIEEVEADGRLSRLPFCALCRWPTVSHGVVVFVQANGMRDSLQMFSGGVDGVNVLRPSWDGRGMAVPCSALDRPWRLVREVHRLRGPARRRWKRASRLVRRAGRRWCRPDRAVGLRAEADRLVGRERAWCRAGGADVILRNRVMRVI